MQRVHVVQDFPQPVEELFAHLSEQENLESLFGAKITRLSDGTDGTRNGAGASRELKVGPLPGFVETNTEVIPDELIRYRITKGGVLKDHEGVMRFSRQGDRVAAGLHHRLRRQGPGRRPAREGHAHAQRHQGAARAGRARRGRVVLTPQRRRSRRRSAPGRPRLVAGRPATRSASCRARRRSPRRRRRGAVAATGRGPSGGTEVGSQVIGGAMAPLSAARRPGLSDPSTPRGGHGPAQERGAAGRIGATGRCSG